MSYTSGRYYGNRRPFQVPNDNLNSQMIGSPNNTGGTTGNMNTGIPNTTSGTSGRTGQTSPTNRSTTGTGTTPISPSPTSGSGTATSPSITPGIGLGTVPNRPSVTPGSGIGTPPTTPSVTPGSGMGTMPPRPGTGMGTVPTNPSVTPGTGMGTMPLRPGTGMGTVPTNPSVTPGSGMGTMPPLPGTGMGTAPTSPSVTPGTGMGTMPTRPGNGMGTGAITTPSTPSAPLGNGTGTSAPGTFRPPYIYGTAPNTQNAAPYPANTMTPPVTTVPGIPSNTGSLYPGMPPATAQTMSHSSVNWKDSSPDMSMNQNYATYQAFEGPYLQNNSYDAPMGVSLYQMYGYDCSADLDKDLDYMIELYPYSAKVILREISSECDSMEYDGSCMFDEYPDRVSLERIVDRIYDKIKDMSEEETTVEANSLYYYPPMRRNNHLRDLVTLVLLGEMFNRRRRYRNRKRWY